MVFAVLCLKSVSSSFRLFLEMSSQGIMIEGIDAVAQYDRDHPNGSDENLDEEEKQMRDEEISFYSNSTNEHGDDNIWGLLSGVGGNIYEW